MVRQANSGWAKSVVLSFALRARQGVASRCGIVSARRGSPPNFLQCLSAQRGQAAPLGSQLFELDSQNLSAHFSVSCWRASHVSCLSVSGRRMATSGASRGGGEGQTGGRGAAGEQGFSGSRGAVGQEASKRAREEAKRARNRQMAMYMGGVTLFTVSLTYASVPLYRIFCQKTGFGGTVKTENVRCMSCSHSFMPTWVEPLSPCQKNPNERCCHTAVQVAILLIKEIAAETWRFLFLTRCITQLLIQPGKILLSSPTGSEVVMHAAC